MSLGNKRKVEFAVALVGNPNVVILDEPTVGMDPDANRNMWGILADLKSKGVSIVLVTHKIDQVTAFSDEMSVMHLGRMRCIGSVTDLKRKFSKGWELKITFKKNTDEDINRKLKKIKVEWEARLTLAMVQDTVVCFLKDTT